jgi:ketosteroid isomerase-like protein
MKGNPMTSQLPPPIAAYIQAKNAHDTAALLACLTDDAVVYDEGETFRGKAAIKEWNDASIRKYQVTVEVTDVAQADGETVVTGLVSGTFEGSPAQLRFHFTVEGNKIAALSIGE